MGKNEREKKEVLNLVSAQEFFREAKNIFNLRRV